ncbi:hypothetical protein LAZ67_15000328 [Cordylochernes scorpioides]|uniref:Uncharacterized protein n=1 Tax=Cordylochernes scorpioides TaxID=51811 RepID=A0ABY6LCT6_9ARAC|nr:hypothetical protein LAZ67_15000328 [Cordylochernes scorpioides]
MNFSLLEVKIQLCDVPGEEPWPSMSPTWLVPKSQLCAFYGSTLLIGVQASETFFRMAVSRGKITPLPHGEIGRLLCKDLMDDNLVHYFFQCPLLTEKRTEIFPSPNFGQFRYHRICQLLSSALDDELLIVRYFKFCTEAGRMRKNAGQRILEDDLSVNREHHLILLRREDLKCTFCGSGITTEMLHYLFDCAALSEERRKLNDKTGQLCPSFPALIDEISKNRFQSPVWLLTHAGGVELVQEAFETEISTQIRNSILGLGCQKFLISRIPNMCKQRLIYFGHIIKRANGLENMLMMVKHNFDYRI